ncbi:aldehyde oxygenase (deformylating) [Ranunculus cassubicifolius]
MASKPGPLTDWPWTFLGSNKYIVLVPLLGHAAHTLFVTESNQRDYTTLFPFFILLSRLIHNQLWISLSRFQNARSKHRIQFKSIEFQQVDRERNWDDQAIMHCILIYVGYLVLPQAKNLPVWNTKGALLMLLVHIGPVEFIYYWSHRALHHHSLFTRYHSHHHSSFVTEPITSVVHPFAEHILYMLIFSLPIFAPVFLGGASLGAIGAYITLVDALNDLGHCNFEFIPTWAFKVFPFLKYLIYTPTYHSLHHSQVHTNFSLFMPIYDYMYKTVDKTTDSLYEISANGREDNIDVVYLTHPTSLNSIYQLRLGFAYLASRPYTSQWYLWMIWPVTTFLMMLIWLFDRTFTVENNKLDKLKMQVWAIPRYSFHFMLESQKKRINGLIEKAILDAESRGAKVISLGLLNQGEELNKNGEIYIQNNKYLKIRVVDGSTLAAAVILNTIPKETLQVLITGNVTKTCSLVVHELLKKRFQVIIQRYEEFKNLRSTIPSEFQDGLVRASSSNRYQCKVWLVDDELNHMEQRRAPAGTIFIPFSMFPINETRKDCVYHPTPSLMIPDNLENIHSCENWLPRRVMSAWRIAGILHALEGWDWHECGNMAVDINKVWVAALNHGFKPS